MCFQDAGQVLSSSSSSSMHEGWQRRWRVAPVLGAGLARQQGVARSGDLAGASMCATTAAERFAAARALVAHADCVAGGGVVVFKASMCSVCTGVQIAL